MSSSISILESQSAHPFPLDKSPVTFHVEQPSFSVPDSLDQATEYIDTRTPKSSLANFTSELVLLLIDELRDIEPEALWDLRSVCRRFYALATPEIYRQVVLTEALVQDGAEYQHPIAFRNMALYTRHVVIRSKLRPEGIRKILQTIHRLATIHWHFEDNELKRDGVWLPSDLLSPSDKNRSDLRLSITDLPLHNFDAESTASYTRAIPADILVSLKLPNPTPRLTARLGSLKELLLRASRLEVLDYQDSGLGTQFEFNQGERLPAVRHLALKSYSWKHSAEEVQEHWDFSRLESLELIDMPTFNFFRSVSFGDFKNLRSLSVEDWSPYLPHRKLEATQLLYALIKYHIRELETLHITCRVPNFPVDAVLMHAATLKDLKLRDHAGFTQDSPVCPTIDLSSLLHLADHMVNVRNLELDMNYGLDDPEDFLRTVAYFKEADTLILHTQTLLQYVETVGIHDDPDARAAETCFMVLLDGRSRMNPDRPWKKITLNVGGWKPTMVSRSGHRWTMLEQLGKYPERCFVLERVEGQYFKTEVMANVIGRRTPEPELMDDDDDDDDYYDDE